MELQDLWVSDECMEYLPTGVRPITDDERAEYEATGHLSSGAAVWECDCSHHAPCPLADDEEGDADGCTCDHSRCGEARAET